jgi:ADP-ribose pyrophosphatase YjhB (NUDIX family)
MKKNEALQRLIEEGDKWFMPSLSVDCVIFGFHDNLLKVLLLKHRHLNLWSLPGGFIYKEESVDAAAQRVLRERTGLNELFLQQFHVFGDPHRYDQEFHRRDLLKDGIEVPNDHWILQRFATVGYYALVDYSKVVPAPDTLTERCVWWEIHKTPALILDHRSIIDKALETLRRQLSYQPVGYNLLPEKFTMPELQKLYETILDKPLDRRNFQRKILGFKIVKRLNETRKGVAHKAPYLYTFDRERYHEALQEGLIGKW